MTRQEGGQCSIGPVRARTAWIAGAAGVAIAAWRKLRPRLAPAPAEDPRADELRRRLEESRTVAEEQHEQAASAETTVDEADAAVEHRRAAVHDRARAAAEDMRGSASSE